MTDTYSGPSGTAGVAWTHRRARRRSRLVVAGSFLYLWAVSNALLLYSHRSFDCTPAWPGDCTVTWRFNPAVPLISALVLAACFVVLWKFAPKVAVAALHPHRTDATCFRQLRNIVEEVSIAANIEPPMVYATDAASVNAAMVATPHGGYALVVTIGALEQLSRRELTGLVANRIAAIASGDAALLTAAVTVANGLNTAADSIMYHTARAARHVRGQAAGAVAGLMAFGFALKLVAYPQALIVRAALSRSRHELADAVALNLTREPAGLRGALEKMEAGSTDLPYPTRATAVLWASDPERPAKRRWGAAMRRLADTHGPLADRIAAVRAVDHLDPAARGPVDRHPVRVDYRASIHPQPAFPVHLRASPGGRIYLAGLVFFLCLAIGTTIDQPVAFAELRDPLSLRLARAAVGAGLVAVYFGLLRVAFRYQRVAIYADRLEVQRVSQNSTRALPATSLRCFALYHIDDVRSIIALFSPGAPSRLTRRVARLAKLPASAVDGFRLAAIVPVDDDEAAKFVYAWCASHGIGVLTDTGPAPIRTPVHYFVPTPLARVERFVNRLPLPLIVLGVALIVAGWWAQVAVV